MNEPRNRDLERRIVATLDAGCQRLDAATQRRLAGARAVALAQPRRAARVGWPAPALAVAGLLLVAVMAVSVLRSAPEPETLPMTTDLDVVTDPRFELILEDPEFVAWLAESDAVEGNAETLPENSG